MELESVSKYLAASLVAYISASAELIAVTSWRFDFHWMGPPARKVTKPVIDLLANNGSSMVSGASRFGWLASWGPQLASA